MNEKKIQRICSDLMFAIVNHSESSKENWTELYAAVCAVKQIVERSPAIDIYNISPEEGDIAEKTGQQIGRLISDDADKATKNYRN